MALSEEQTKQLAELERLRDEPEPKSDGGGIGRVVNVALDLGDDTQVERAFRLGLLERPAEDGGDGDDGDGDDGDGKPDGDDGDGPKRRGFFDG